MKSTELEAIIGLSRAGVLRSDTLTKQSCSLLPWYAQKELNFYQWILHTKLLGRLTVYLDLWTAVIEVFFSVNFSALGLWSWYRDTKNKN